MKRNTRLNTFALVLTLLFLNSHARAQSTDAPKLEVGGLYSSLTLDAPDTFGTETEAGVGGRVTYNITDSFAVEAEGSFYPTRSRYTLTTGGRAVQGQFGVKFGKRFERFGLFAKARPGLISFGNVATVSGTLTDTFAGNTFTFPVFEQRRKTHFTTDLGGVLEFYPSRKIVTRFDFGDTLIRYGGHQAPGPILITPGTETVTIIERPATTKHNFQFTAGIGFRF